MTPEERTAEDVAKALKLAEASEYEDVRERPRAFVSGALEVYLTNAYRLLALAEKRAAQAQATIDALHAFHGETEEVLYRRLRPHGLILTHALGGEYVVVPSLKGGEVFRGSEAEVLAWAGSVDLDEVAA